MVYPLMDKQNIDTQLNNALCEAAGCFAKAENKIDVRVGLLGTIPLLLCKDCITKFDDSDNLS
jgi:hypothetical protein